jgi:putative tryptophan/tyrosine transport system substrate-binding protein
MIAGTAAALATIGRAGAQPLAGVPRIGFMARAMYPEFDRAFTQELARLGHVDGRNLVIERRLARADLSDVPAQAAELAAMDLKFIVVGSSTWANAVIRTNPAIPMIIVTAAAMVESGYAISRERPGRNITGGDELPPGLTVTRMTLLKRVAPGVTQIGLLAAAEDAAYRVQLADAAAAASRLGVIIKPYPAPSPRAIEQALAAMMKDGVNGLVNFQSGFSLAHRQFIVDFAAKHRLPGIYQATRFVDAGGLMAWSPDQDEQFREAARTAHRVLRGARIGEIPIRYPARYVLTINVAAAEALNLNIPADLRRKADLRHVGLGDRLERVRSSLERLR